MSLPTVDIKRGAERRLRKGHLWVYANELAVAPAKLEVEPGQLVALSLNKRAFGVGYINPGSLIAVRVLDRDPNAQIDEGWFIRRIEQAAALREGLVDPSYMRLLHGEADGIPGLVVDRFDQLLVAQSGTAGVDRCRPMIEAALKSLYPQSALLWRNQGPARALEGVDEQIEVAFGEVPERCGVSEHGRRFWFRPFVGQKTGWYYDQRENRQRIAALASGRRVLDVCSYLGGFAVSCAAAGAQSVLAVDGSAEALSALAENAAENGVSERIETLHGDAFSTLVGLFEQGQRFGLVIIDPPAFIKRRKDADQGVQAYRRLASLALRLVEPGGFLASFSCSHLFPRDGLVEALARAAMAGHRRATIVAELHAGSDHPVHPAMPETEYLKGLLARVEA